VTAFDRVLWIGGGTGGGKSSIAIALAEKHRLVRYNYDWHDSRGHSERTRADRHPKRAAFLAMSMDERWVTRSPVQMAEMEIVEFRERFEMVLEDVAALSADRVVADGFGLLPELVGPVLADQRQAIFLLPTPMFREWSLAQRGWVTIDGTSDGDRARANKLARDALLTEHVRRSAAARGLTTLEVDGTRSLADLTTDAERQFAPLLD
jgi:hypothetical protein